MNDDKKIGWGGKPSLNRRAVGGLIVNVSKKTATRKQQTNYAFGCCPPQNWNLTTRDVESVS